MAFKPSRRVNGEHAAFEYPALMTANEACALGQALVINPATGALTAAGDDTDGVQAEFIAMQAVAAAAVPTVKPAVMRIDESQEWEAPLGAVNGTPAPIVLGSKLTLHTDEVSLSYVTTKGYFMVSALENTGNAVVGDKVLGYFRR
jgi:hypothetical protein